MRLGGGPSTLTSWMAWKEIMAEARAREWEKEH
jgi:hypothetical protein